MRRTVLIVALGAAVALAVSASGSGAPAQHQGVIAGDDAPAPIQVVGLSDIERKAVDISSVMAAGAPNAGVFVRVKFRGNFEQAIGKGGLEDAGAAMILLPKARNALSAGLITDGVGVGHLHRETRSTDVGVFRDGNQLDFFLSGPGYDMVKSVKIVTVLDTGAIGPNVGPGSTPPFMGQKPWNAFAMLHPIDVRVQTADTSAFTCPELKNVAASIDQDLNDPAFARHRSYAAARALKVLRLRVTELLGPCASAPKPGGVFTWSQFSPIEVAGVGRFTGPAATFDRIRVTLQGGFTITNQLCPVQLPNPAVSGNTLDCSGGILKTNEMFKLNLQTTPAPTTKLGGKIGGFRPSPVSLEPFSTIYLGT